MRILIAGLLLIVACAGSRPAGPKPCDAPMRWDVEKYDDCPTKKDDAK